MIVKFTVLKQNEILYKYIQDNLHSHCNLVSCKQTKSCSIDLVVYAYPSSFPTINFANAVSQYALAVDCCVVMFRHKNQLTIFEYLATLVFEDTLHISALGVRQV